MCRWKTPHAPPARVVLAGCLLLQRALPSPMLLPILVSTSRVSANSVDCTRANTPTKKAICSAPYTLELNSTLGLAWKTAKTKVADVSTLKAERTFRQCRLEDNQARTGPTRLQHQSGRCLQFRNPDGRSNV